MGEKRKPKYTLLLKGSSKAKLIKVELFPIKLWIKGHHGIRFRLRVNGKWWSQSESKQFVTKTEARELFFKLID